MAKDHLVGAGFKKKQPVRRCPECPKLFGHGGHLKQHVITVHRKEKNFTCLICNKAFGIKFNLKRHVKTIHEFDKPFTCFICNLSFGQSGHFKSHFETVHENAKVFTCLICHQSFQRRYHLKKHRQNAHPKHLQYSNNTDQSLPMNSDQTSMTDPIPGPSIKIQSIDEEADAEDDCKVYVRSLILMTKTELEEEEVAPSTKCIECNLAVESGALAKHMEHEHSRVERFDCTKCPSNFLLKSEFFSHVENVHPQSMPEFKARYVDVHNLIQDDTHSDSSALPNTYRHENIKNDAQVAGAVGDVASLSLVRSEKKNQVNTSIEQRTAAEVKEVLEIFDTDQGEVIQCSTCHLTFASYKLLSKHQEDHFWSAEKQMKNREAFDISSSHNEDNYLLQCPLCFVNVESRHLDMHFLQHSKSMIEKERKRRAEEERLRKSRTEDEFVYCPDPSCFMKFYSKILLYEHALKEHNNKQKRSF